MARAEVIKDIRAELEGLERRKAEINSLVGSLQATLRYFEGLAEEHRSAAIGCSDMVKQVMYDIIKDKGAPVHRGDMLDLVKARGIDVNGKDPVNALGAHMSGDERFVSIGGGRWDLKERQPTRVIGTPVERIISGQPREVDQLGRLIPVTRPREVSNG